MAWKRSPRNEIGFPRSCYVASGLQVWCVKYNVSHPIQVTPLSHGPLRTHLGGRATWSWPGDCFPLTFHPPLTHSVQFTQTRPDCRQYANGLPGHRESWSETAASKEAGEKLETQTREHSCLRTTLLQQAISISVYYPDMELLTKGYITFSW